VLCIECTSWAIVDGQALRTKDSWVCVGFMCWFVQCEANLTSGMREKLRVTRRIKEESWWVLLCLCIVESLGDSERITRFPHSPSPDVVVVYSHSYS
jgi:hypothetical protein